MAFAMRSTTMTKDSLPIFQLIDEIPEAMGYL